MRPEELRELIRRQPFMPMRLHLTDGKSYDIRHPENILVSRSYVHVGVDADSVTGVIGRVDFVSLLHIVRVEDMPVGVPPGGNGQSS